MRKPQLLIIFPTKAMAYTFYLDFFHNLIGDNLVSREGYNKLEFKTFDIILSGEACESLRGNQFIGAYVSDFMSRDVVEQIVLPCCENKRERINFV